MSQSNKLRLLHYNWGIMNFYTNPPTPSAIRPAWWKPANARFMKSMASWANLEYETALHTFARDPLRRKAYLHIRYRMTPAMVLTYHPNFQDILDVTNEEWDRLDVRTQRMFHYANLAYQQKVN